MWQLLPAKVLYGYFAIVAVASFLAVYLFQKKRRLFPESSRSRSKRVLAALPPTITLVAGITVLVGKYTWGIAAQFDFVQESVFPDIRGSWSGTVNSIWRDIPTSRDQIPFADTVKDGKVVDVIARVHQDWFSVKVDLETGSKYSRSVTLAVWPEVKSSVNSIFRLWYVYQNETPEPLEGDTILHNGAAVVEFERNGIGKELNGHYWTDRNWSLGKNTAGRIRLRHFSLDLSSPAPPKTTQ